MNVSNVLVGIASDDRITAGMFFRLTFAQTRFLGLPVGGFFGFQSNAQGAFNKLDAADGWAQPVSDLAVAPGQETAVFDVLVRPVAVGIMVADLANYFDGLHFGVSLTSMTPVDVAAVQGGSDERSQLQAELDLSAKQKNPFSVFGDYAKYLEWILILLLIVALLYYGEKAFKLAKAVV